MSEKRKIILDVDTGSDDALAIMAAVLSPEAFDIVGICSVNGNCPLPNTTENTLRVVDLLGVGDKIPVIQGCATPMVATLDPLRPMRLRPTRHLDEDGNEVSYHALYVALPPSKTKVLEGADAATWYVDTLRKATEKITIIAVGPLTNLGMAFRIDPTIVDNIEEIVIMGGGFAEFNSTAASEFNIWIDPEAAQIVMTCGAKITIMPLDATHRANLRPKHMEIFRSWGNAIGDFAAIEVEDRVKAYNLLQPLHEPDISPIHDALCVLYLLDPTVITDLRHMRVDIDISGGFSDGQTIMDTRYFNDNPKNAYVCFNTDEEKFADMMIDILGRSKDM